MTLQKDVIKVKNNWIISGRKGLVVFPPMLVESPEEAMSLVASSVANHFKGLEVNDDMNCYYSMKFAGIDPDAYEPGELIRELAERGIITLEMNDRSTDVATIFVLRIKLPGFGKDQEFIFMINRLEYAIEKAEQRSQCRRIA